MRSKRLSSAVACAAPFSVALACLLASAASPAQKADPQVELIAKRNAIEQQLEAVAVIDRKVMVKMRDGKRMAADIYRPKNAAGKVPIIFSRTPYNFNFWDVKLGAPRDMSRELQAVKAGYAYVNMNERGHYFSEGNYDILGAPLTDGVDAVNWMASQPWSNGKVGTTGCSSTAEWQMAVVAQDDPHLAAFNVQGFGAGVGKVGPYWEQGNWYRGGAVQMLFIAWIYGEQNQVRPMFPKDATQAELINASRMFDLDPQMPPVDWDKAFWHLPENGIIAAVDAYRRQHDRPRTERSCVAQGWPVERGHADQAPGPVVHELVRCVGVPQPCRLQPRAQDRAEGRGRPAVRRDRPGAALRLYAGHRAHHGG
jgi:predicted acyl esterase